MAGGGRVNDGATLSRGGAGAGGGDGHQESEEPALHGHHHKERALRYRFRPQPHFSLRRPFAAPPFAVAIIRRRRIARFERLKKRVQSFGGGARAASAAGSSGIGAATASEREGRGGGMERVGGESELLLLLLWPLDRSSASGGCYENVHSTSSEMGNKTPLSLSLSSDRSIGSGFGSSDIFSWGLHAFIASSRPPSRREGPPGQVFLQSLR